MAQIRSTVLRMSDLCLISIVSISPCGLPSATYKHVWFCVVRTCGRIYEAMYCMLQTADACHRLYHFSQDEQIELILILVNKVFTQMHNETWIYVILQNAVTVGKLAVEFTLNATQSSDFFST